VGDLDAELGGRAFEGGIDERAAVVDILCPAALCNR